MKRGYQDFFLGHSPDLIGRLHCNKKSGDNEPRITIFKMDKYRTKLSIDVSDELLKVVKKLSKIKLGDTASIYVKTLTIVRGETGRLFVVWDKVRTFCLLDYADGGTLEENEKRLKESYDFLIKIFTLILKWVKSGKSGTKPNIKFPDPPSTGKINNKSSFISYHDPCAPAVFTYYELPNAGGFNINIEGSQYSSFVTNKNGEVQGHLSDLIEGLELIQKNSQVYQMFKLSKSNPSHYVTSSPGEHKGKDGKRIPIVVINFDNSRSLNKVLFAGYPETLKDLIVKLKEANKDLTKHFNKEI